MVSVQVPLVSCYACNLRQVSQVCCFSTLQIYDERRPVQAMLVQDNTIITQLESFVKKKFRYLQIIFL